MYSAGFIASGRRRCAPCRWQAAQLDLLGVVQRDPAGAALELAPLGCAGPGALCDDGVGALVADGTVGAVVGAGPLADVKHIGRDLHEVGGGRAGAAGLDVGRVRPPVHGGAAAGYGDQVVGVRLALGDGRDLSLAGLAARRARGRGADVVLGAGKLHHVADLDVGGAAGGSPGGGCAAAGAELTVDFGRDLVLQVVEVVARAGFRRIVPVHCHVAAVQVADAVVFAGRPDELLDAVALADVGHEIQQRVVCLISDGVGVRRVAGDLDGDGTLVVGVGRRAPRAVALVHIEGDAAVGADAVVAGRLPAALSKQSAAALDGELAGHTVDRDGVDLFGALARVVGAELGVGDQSAVTHPRHPPFRHRRAWRQGSFHPRHRRPRRRSGRSPRRS